MNQEPLDENEHSFKTVEAKEVHFPDDGQFFITNPIWRFFSRWAIIIVCIIVQPISRIFWGYRVKGKKNWKKVKNKGIVIVGNHIHPLDAFMMGTNNPFRRVYVTSLMSNLGLPFGIGKLFRLLGCSPIPSTKEGLRNFSIQFSQIIDRRQKILVYPEAALIPYCDHIRNFKKGAFRLCLNGKNVILPIVWTFHKPRGLYRLFRRKPCMHLTYLEPYYPNYDEPKGVVIEKTKNEIHDMIEKYFNENTNYKYTKKA